ncbi:MAG: hypothetical protein ABIO70_02845 [Pseudomonadota bacterium]
MGFLDLIFGGGGSQLDRQCKRVQNINAQPEDREAAALFLAGDGGEQAIYGLLGRFDVRIENAMKDANEKAFVFDLLVELGPPVLEPAILYVKRCKNLANPLRLIETLGGREPLLLTVLEMLDEEAVREDFKPDRKRHLLVKLADYRDERVTPSAVRFLADFDEGVRYAAAQAVIHQETDAGREELLVALANPEEESNRVRVRIGETFAGRRWPLGEHAAALAENPPQGFQVRNGLLIPA